MGKPYFRIIQTAAGDEEWVRNIQQQKLNNYAKYKQAWTDKEIIEVPDRAVVSYVDFKINHMSTASATKDYTFILTTTLCCEDEDEEKGQGY